MSPTQIELENRLTEGDLEGALDGLLSLARHYGDKARGADAVLLSGRYYDLLKQQQRELLSLDDYQLERNQISYATLEMVRRLPVDWSVNALPPSERSRRTKALKKGLGWVIGVAVVALIVAVVLALGTFGGSPQPSPVVDTPTETVPQTEVSKTTSPPPTTTETPASGSAETPPATQPRQQKSNPTPARTPAPAENKSTESTPAATTPAAGSGSTLPGSYATDDGKFHGFSRISEGMERGQIGQKFAFRNLQTKATLCCYDAAADFSGGLARVTQDGQTFYIDKNGKRFQK